MLSRSAALHMAYTLPFLRPWKEGFRMPEEHIILDGTVYLYKRPNSSFWQCSTYLADKNWRITTKKECLSRAKEIAEDWYL